MNRVFSKCLFLGLAILFFSAASAVCRADQGPLDFLKAQERKNRYHHGQVYLGKVLTIFYEPYGVTPDPKYDPYLLELTDVLKTPLRDNYRIVIKGHSDTSGSQDDNLRLSWRRAEALKQVLIKRFYFQAERITAGGVGAIDPIASNETPEGRSQNRRVEIHIYGDVSEAVRFVEKQ